MVVWWLVALSFLLPTSFAFVPRAAVSASSRHDTSLGMSLTLYGSPGSRSPLVDWALYELGLDFTMGDLAENPHPFGQIPCLVDNDVIVFESGAILIYLESKASTKLSQAERAQVLSWVAWANASLDPICFLETPDGKVYDTGLRKPNRRIEKLNDILENNKGDYLVGDTFTVADVSISSYLLYVLQFFPDIDLSRWPHLVTYMKTCVSRPAYGKAFGERIQQFLTQALTDMGKPRRLFDNIF